MRFDRLFFAILGFLFRLGLLLLGLLLMVFVLALSFFMVLGWGLYALVARLMGWPVQPLAFTILRQTQAQFFRRGVRPDAQGKGGGEVIDVNSREVDAPPSDRLGR